MSNGDKEFSFPGQKYEYDPPRESRDIDLVAKAIARTKAENSKLRIFALRCSKYAVGSFGDGTNDFINVEARKALANEEGK